MGAGASEDGECRIRYHDLVFEPDMLTAVRDDGAVLQLSRRERAVVRALAQRPHRLLTRDQLLAAMAPHDAELPDRKVDITINRLRRKLNDPARAPRFIATQYGEGYVWIAEALPQPAIAALLVIGPVRSPDAVGAAAQALLERLRQAILAHTAAGHTVLLRPEWRPDGPGAPCRCSLEASFLAQASGPTAALVLREEPSRHVVLSLRMAASAQPDLSRLAAELVGAIWRRVALGAPGAATPTDVPLPLRMQAAAVLLGPPNDPWEENERRAALARGEDPADPAAALMWAMTRYARLMFPPDWAAADLEGYGAVQEEIEGLVFASLQAARGDPILSVAAAQLLLWTGRGHMDLAEELAQAALSSTTAFAAALPVHGQVRGYRGDTDVALRLFD